TSIHRGSGIVFTSPPISTGGRESFFSCGRAASRVTEWSVTRQTISGAHTKSQTISDPPVIGGAGDVRLVQGDAEALHPSGAISKVATGDCRGDAIEDYAREKLRGGVAPLELGDFVQIAEIQLAERRAQNSGRPSDVDDNAVPIELVAPELEIDDEGRTVQALCRSEQVAGEAVRDHEVIAHRDRVHATSTSRDERSCRPAPTRAAPSPPADPRTGSRR